MDGARCIAYTALLLECVGVSTTSLKRRLSHVASRKCRGLCSAIAGEFCGSWVIVYLLTGRLGYGVVGVFVWHSLKILGQLWNCVHNVLPRSIRLD